MAALDTRTLIFALVLNNLALAAALLVAVPPKMRLGVNQWVASLVLQAAAFSSFVWRDGIPEILGVVVAQSCTATSLVLQASALLKFYGRSTRLWWKLAFPIFALTLHLTLVHDARTRVTLSGWIYGTAMLVIGIVALRQRETDTRLGHRMLLSAFFLGSGMMFLRAITGLIRPDAYLGFRGLGVMPAVSTLIAQLVALAMAFGFLLMHRERQENEIARLAMMDSLTGAYNRRALFERGEAVFAHALRVHEPMSVVIFDLEFFKSVNDTHGHLVGDEVLRRFASIAQSCLRSNDVLARYGGEEFCVLIPDGTLEGARTIAERVRVAVAEHAFEVDGQRITVTSSAGVACLDGQSVTTLPALLKKADAALYEAKRDGRNRVSSWPAAPIAVER